MTETYTYQDYLSIWEDHHGEANQGEFFYWNHGVRRSKQLSKMSETQFSHAVADVDRLGSIIDGLQKRSDYGNNTELDDKVDALLSESFTHELALFY